MYIAEDPTYPHEGPHGSGWLRHIHDMVERPGDSYDEARLARQPMDCGCNSIQTTLLPVPSFMVFYGKGNHQGVA